MDASSEVSSVTDHMSNTQTEANVEPESIICALDFGTTYSGFAYCLSRQPSNIQIVKEWSGARGVAYEKCPSLLKYEEDGSIRWGFELDRTTEGCIEAIKLLLDPTQPSPSYISAMNLNAARDGLAKAPTAIVTDFVRAMFNHATAKIDSKYHVGYFQRLKKQYVVTVPAVWSDKAQDATLRAARNAGLGPVRLVKEPEAAALFTLHQMGDQGLEVGDAFVICDAGGGTVDLISYEITSLKPFALKELVAATGELAGSLMLNQRFECHIKDVVGESDFVRIRKTSAYAQAMKHFDEVIKPGFNTSDDHEQFVTFPRAQLKDLDWRGLSRDTLTVKRTTLQEIFDPIIDDIDRLVTDQVSQVRLRRSQARHPQANKITAIFLVGGFGASTYLYETLTAKNEGIRVIQPNDAWSAIVRGAVMSNLPSEASVVSTVAPKHYGISAREYDIDPIHDAHEEKFYSNYHGKSEIDRMTWFIHQGDDLMRACPIEVDCWAAFTEKPSFDTSQEVSILWECEDPVPPRHPRGDRIKSNCTLTADLSGIPKKHLEKKVGHDADGSIFQWWLLRFKFVVTFQSGPMLFSINCHGEQYGSVEVTY